MSGTEAAGGRSGEQVLQEPRVGGSVWPRQRCPAFVPRRTALGARPECWYCQHADFHLTEAVALDVGICRWPRIQLE